MRTLVLLVAMTALASLTGCADKPTTSECEALLANAVRIELSGRGIADDKLEARATKVSEIARDEYMKQCMETMAAARVRCGVEAKDRAALDACDESID